MSATRRWWAAAAMAGLLATAGVGWHSATTSSSSPQPVRTAARRPSAAPTLPTTTAPPTTTTLPPTTTTAPPPPTTTTVRPATTAAPRPTTTTGPRATTTAPPPPPPTTAAPAPPPSGTAGQLLRAVNARRATGTTCGGTWYPAVPALSIDARLTAAAQGHAQDMATRGYFSHTGLDGSTPDSRMAAAGYHGSGWAENIAAGQTSVTEVMTAWWNSPAHCADFMAGFVTQVGFGLVTNPSSPYGTYWVADMAQP